MRYFICLLDPLGRGISDSVCRAHEPLPRSYGLEFTWQQFGQAVVLTAGDDTYGEPLIAVAGEHLAVGMVRLDNRSEVERWTGSAAFNLTDLELVLRAVARDGGKCIPSILGDFAFAIWDQTTRRAVVATDAFAVKKLYYSERDGLIMFSSRSEALGTTYNVQHLAELAVGGELTPGLTAYDGVRHLPGGTLGILENQNFTTRAYWDPHQFRADPASPLRPERAAESCRSLLAEGVRLRMSRDGPTWAQLSGGLDSSSIVSLTQWLAERGQIADGLAGTVSYVDRADSESDEREYSDLVVSRWGLRNQTIVDSPLWTNGNTPPPRTDRPRDAIATHQRERALATIVQNAGGRVLLSGVGGDELFTGTMLFFADWVASGRIWSAIREMARRAAMGRVSFWELAYRNAVLPLLPQIGYRWLLGDDGKLMPWLRRDAVRLYRLRERVTVAVAYGGPVHEKYHYAAVVPVKAISSSHDTGFLGELLDIRYPFLYRPLAEFALRLPPDLCARPQARKWVLREAMRGILPDRVRTRIGKGDPLSAFSQSFSAQRDLLEPLVREPILAELGIVDAKRLRSEFDAAPLRPYRKDLLHNHLQSILLLEAWLQLRSGRWPLASHTQDTVIPTRQVH